jgi:hypothetical protein
MKDLDRHFLDLRGAAAVHKIIRRYVGKDAATKALILQLNSLLLETQLSVGAGEGNRTLVFSLEGCCSTIELHPRIGLN